MASEALIVSATLFGLLITYFMIPVVKKVAVSNDIIAYPGGRRNQEKPVPLMGGLAIFLPMLMVFFGALLADLLGYTNFSNPMRFKLLSLFLGCCWMLLLGTLDDKMNLSWKKKLVGELFGIVILIWGGHTIGNTTVPLFGPVDFGIFGYVILGVSVLIVTNAINLIDGIDGLAGGVCLFAAITSGLVAFLKNDILASVLVFTLAGSLVAYLKFNFHPASIYMGDGGSLTLGYFLSVLATSNMAIFPGQRSGTMSMIIVPLLPFGVALIDVFLAVVRRWVSGRKIFLPDADHLHHRFMEVFGKPRVVVSIFYLFSAIFCIITICMVLIPDSNYLFEAVCFISFVVIFSMAFVLRLYRIDMLPTIIKNRPDFKFLSSFHTFMTMRVRKARSLEELLGLMEAGVRDLDFDSVEVTVPGKWSMSWINPDCKHENSCRNNHSRIFRGSTITVKWTTPTHDSRNYQKYLELVWHWFLNQTENRARNFVNKENRHNSSIQSEIRKSMSDAKISA
ncbi:MAG: MraY family glycosyltransferase [Syntrophaceae bacterium]|nr:MraY family glycosyltransferase [Syntrophaceae bacterium]